MTMVQDAVSITASLKAMRHRLFDLEISQHSRKKWHTHAALLADSATLIEMEADSLDKADRSQIHSLIRKASEVDSKLKKKIDMAQLQQEMEHVATARRRALKSLQKQMNLLKNRFDGAVEDLVLQLGCNVKKELNNRPTKKEMAEMVSTLNVRIQSLENGGQHHGGRHGRRQSIVSGGGQPGDETTTGGQQATRNSENGDYVDANGVLRFDTGINDEEDGDDADQFKRMNKKINQMNDMANQRHSMFLALQHEVLNLKTNQNVVQGQMEQIELKQKELSTWKSKQIDPLLTSMKALVEQFETDGGDRGGDANLRDKNQQLENHVYYLLEQVDEFKKKSDKTVLDYNVARNYDKKEIYTNMSKLERDILKCKDGIDALEIATTRINDDTKIINNDVLDLWNLGKCSVVVVVWF